MSRKTGPKPGDTAQQLMLVDGIGTTLVPVTITSVSRSSDRDYPYLVTFEYSYIAAGTAHAGEITTRLNVRGEDQHVYTVNYQRGEDPGYLVPVDPMDEIQCDSCQ